MTVICYNNGILAGDSLTSSNDVKYHIIKKLFIINNCAYGFANSGYAVKKYIDFLEGKVKKYETPEGEDFEAIKIDLKTKKVYMLSSWKNLICEDEILDDFISIGHGRELSLGAMQMNASSIGACKIACKFDGKCGEPIYCIDTKDKKPKIMKCL